MVWKTMLVFGLQSKQLPTTIYQTNYTKPNLLNQIFPWGSNQIYSTNYIKPNPPSQICKIKSTKQNVLNVKKQIYQTRSFQLNLQNKINPTNSTKPNLRKIKWSPSPAWAELGPAQPQLAIYTSYRFCSKHSYPFSFFKLLFSTFVYIILHFAVVFMVVC